MNMGPLSLLQLSCSSSCNLHDIPYHYEHKELCTEFVQPSVLFFNSDELKLWPQLADHNCYYFWRLQKFILEYTELKKWWSRNYISKQTDNLSCKFLKYASSLKYYNKHEYKIWTNLIQTYMNSLMFKTSTK